MKILNRFLLKHFLRILWLCVSAFIGIYLLIDFFEKVDDFIDHQAGVADYLSYFGNSIPVIFVQILPLAILTTMVLTLGGLGRTNETTAMRACGVSLWRIVQPLMALALVLSFLLLLLNEFLIPWNAKQLNQLLEVKLKGKQTVELTRNEIWYRSGRRIINIALADPQQMRLQGVTLFSFNDGQKLRSRLDAPSVSYENGQWLAPRSVERFFDPVTGDLTETLEEDRRVFELDRTPEDFTSHENFNNALNFRELRAIANKLEREGYDATRQRVDMHNRLAAPFTCLIMGFLGIPFALQRGRNSNIALGIGLSLGIGVVYFILQSLVTAFGYSRAVPPLLAAWITNVIFLMFGIWLLLNLKE